MLVTHAKMAIRATTFCLALTVPQGGSALPGILDATCSIKGRAFVLDTGHIRVPSQAAVLLPSGELLRLRYPPEYIDTLGPQYPRGHVSIPFRTLKGVDSSSRHVAVFTVPGTYRFLMQDANTAEGMELHQLQCNVTLTKAQIDATGL